MYTSHLANTLAWKSIFVRKKKKKILIARTWIHICITSSSKYRSIIAIQKTRLTVIRREIEIERERESTKNHQTDRQKHYVSDYTYAPCRLHWQDYTRRRAALPLHLLQWYKKPHGSGGVELIYRLAIVHWIDYYALHITRRTYARERKKKAKRKLWRERQRALHFLLSSWGFFFSLSMSLELQPVR